MDIFDGVRIIGRWWFVAVPLLFVTILATVGATANFSPEYTTEASVLFVGPTVTENEQNEVERVNPLLNQSSALVTAAVVTSISIGGPEVAEILDNEGLSTDYDVGTEARSPILLLVVRADSDETATATALRMLELVERDVQLRQEAVDVPDNLRVSTSVIGLSPIGGADYGSRDRVRIALVVIGLGLSGAIVFGLEGLSRRRARQGTSASEPDVVEAAGDSRDEVAATGDAATDRTARREREVLDDDTGAGGVERSSTSSSESRSTSTGSRPG